MVVIKAVGFSSERGFTYLGLLLVIAVLSIGLSAASEVWVTTARRQKMDELNWIGAQFIQAIGSYYQASSSTRQMYPARLEELLEDRRSPVVRRHLRVIYLNPLTARADWEPVLAADGRMRGVRASVQTDGGSEVREFVYVPQ